MRLANILSAWAVCGLLVGTSAHADNRKTIQPIVVTTPAPVVIVNEHDGNRASNNLMAAAVAAGVSWLIIHHRHHRHERHGRVQRRCKCQ